MNAALSPAANGDPINRLPTDASIPSHDELQIINSIFRENKASGGRIFEEAKEVVILVILFIVLSIEPLDKGLKKVVPAANNQYVLILIKGIILGVAFYVIKNFYLVRKNDKK